MFLVYNNLSAKLIRELESIFPDMQHVEHLGLDESDDLVLWGYASTNELHILTKDADFNDLQNIKGFPPKIVWVRSGNVSTKYIAELLFFHKKGIEDFLQDEQLGIMELF